MPEETHPKTYAGTVCHEIFEFLGETENREKLENFKNLGFRIEENDELLKMTNDLVEKFNIIDSVSIAIPDMIEVGAKYLYEIVTDPNVKEYICEHEFTLKTDKYEIKGFIDLLVLYKDGSSLIVDYKSQGKKFDKSKMDFNIQALVYQLASLKGKGLNPAVNFIMLRYPPTPRSKDRHIQRVEYIGEESLQGLESYLEYIYEYLSKFDLDKSYSNFCADNPKNAWFCQYVCQFKNPLIYFEYLSKDGEIIQTSIEKLENKPEGTIEQKVNFKGCPKFNN